MTIGDALSLIGEIDVSGKAARWADLGCGDGLFTRALGQLLPTGSMVYGIDRVTGLSRQRTPEGVEIIPMIADFVSDALSLKELDGLLMANSLHYVRDKTGFIRKIRSYLTAGAKILVVEYDTDAPVARWVPYPLSFVSLSGLFRAEGFSHIRKLGERPSRYNSGSMYAAEIW